MYVAGLDDSCKVGLLSRPPSTTRIASCGNSYSTFNTTGSVQTPVNTGNDKVWGLAIQPGGQIVVSGECDRPIVGVPGFVTTEFCVVRYTTAGALDTSFNSTGIVQVAVSANGRDTGNAVSLQADGKIVVAGACGNQTATFADICVARFTAAGVLDTSFNGTGKVVTLGTGLNTALSAT